MNDRLLQPSSFKVVLRYVCMYVCGFVCAGVCTAQLVCEGVQSLEGRLCISPLLPPPSEQGLVGVCWLCPGISASHLTIGMLGLLTMPLCLAFNGCFRIRTRSSIGQQALYPPATVLDLNPLQNYHR